MHKDTPIFVPGSSSTTDRQLDIWNENAPGEYCRPSIFANAEYIKLDQDGLSICWKDGYQTKILTNAIACWAVTCF